MNEIMVNELTKTEAERASELHGKILASREQVTDALCTFAMHLKAMRDGKLYTLLGYDSFDNYVEDGVNIAKRQVYNYISTYEKLGGTVLQSNATLGITKLQLLTLVSDVDRSEFIENNDLNGMSVTEIQELIKQSKEQVEQISFLQEKVTTLESENEDNEVDEQILNSIEKQRDELLAELEAIKAKPIDVAVAEPSQADLDKIIADIEAETKAKYEKTKKADIDAATEKLTEDLEKNKQVEIDKARAEGERVASEKLQKALADIDSEKAELLRKTEKLAKELEVKGNDDIVTFKCYFENFQGNFLKLIDNIKAVENTETQAKLLKVIKAYINQSVVPVLEEITL